MGIIKPDTIFILFIASCVFFAFVGIIVFLSARGPSKKGSSAAEDQALQALRTKVQGFDELTFQLKRDIEARGEEIQGVKKSFRDMEEKMAADLLVMKHQNASGAGDKFKTEIDTIKASLEDFKDSTNIQLKMLIDKVLLAESKATKVETAPAAEAPKAEEPPKTEEPPKAETPPTPAEPAPPASPTSSPVAETPKNS